MMFLFSHLLFVKGELINRIENHVMDAKEQVEAGYKQVDEAKKKQTAAKKVRYIRQITLYSFIYAIIIF
jgi:t-SNARE complex subunit (syntaxin)